LGDLLQPDGFHKVGESRVLEVTGHFSDGPDALLTRSKLTTYESSATSVVTVDGTGGVTAVGPGTARITVKNGNAILVVPVRVPNQQ
jgi:hypothetical protein